MDRIIIRRALETESDECAKQMSSSDPWITLGMDYERCLNSVSDTQKELYVAEKEHELAGLLLLNMNGAFTGYVQSICVFPKFRGNGLGHDMLSFAENRIFSERKNVFLCVSSFYRTPVFQVLKTLRRKDYISASDTKKSGN